MGPASTGVREDKTLAHVPRFLMMAARLICSRENIQNVDVMGLVFHPQ